MWLQWQTRSDEPSCAASRAHATKARLPHDRGDGRERWPCASRLPIVWPTEPGRTGAGRKFDISCFRMSRFAETVAFTSVMGLHCLSTRRVCVRCAGRAVGRLGFGPSEAGCVVESARSLPLALGVWPGLPASGRCLVGPAASVLGFGSPHAAVRLVSARFVGRSAGGVFARRMCGGRQFRHLHQGDRARVVAC